MTLNNGAVCASEDYLPDAVEILKETDFQLFPVTLPEDSYRQISPGMGEAVARRTILRRKTDGNWESWGDVATRVALGNSSLFDGPVHSSASENAILRKHLASGATLMSGRHLQHGDASQPTRGMEPYTNCASSPVSFMLFYLLLNGSGVGRSYDDDLMAISYDNAPNLRCVLSSEHKDFDWSAHESLRDAQHKYAGGADTLWHEVADSREGWAKAVEIFEIASFEKIHKDKLLILDFSKVRPKGAPIAGMQNRPSSGPVPLMNALAKIATLKGAGLPKFWQSMFVDHYLAECVLVGGARRAARMSTKIWSDPFIFDFITIKRPLEYRGKTAEEILALRAENPFPPFGFLWSSNNSVVVDAEFWALVRGDSTDTKSLHAKAVFKIITEAAYADQTGEPGFINIHRLVSNSEGWGNLTRGDYIGSPRYQVEDETQILLAKLAKRVEKKKYRYITNPCGEATLNILGAFCTLGDLVPYHCESLDEVEDAARAVTRALIRINSMDSVFKTEVRRTNRIGVGITGVHEFAWKFFKFGFRDLLDEQKSKDFWLFLSRINRAIYAEAETYSKEIGLPTPHTVTCVKPSGSVSKLFLLSEGWHLPSRREFLRYVQFRNDDPLVGVYKAAGYPTRELVQYSGTTIVGFPTAPTLTTLGMGDALVTSSEATPEEHFKWLMLGEKYWIHGTDDAGVPVKGNYGQSISYTLQYDPKIVSLAHFQEMILKYQSEVRCCAMMPQTDNSVAYEYQPEQGVRREEYLEILARIQSSTVVAESVSREHVDCASGGCPISWDENVVIAVKH